MFFQIDEKDVRDDDDSIVFRGSLRFYHYRCDGKNDVGWGCAYRTIQSLSSWIIETKTDCSIKTVPTIDEIQQILVDLEDKPPSFKRSNQWIGTCEAAIVLNQLFDVKNQSNQKTNYSRMQKFLSSVFRAIHDEYKTDGSDS